MVIKGGALFGVEVFGVGTCNNNIIIHNHQYTFINVVYFCIVP